MNGANRGFLAFLRDTGGNVLPLAAIGMVLSAALVGGGIDMSRAYRVENRLQSACDSAVLAGRRAIGSNGYRDAVEKVQANNYFATNFDEASMESTGTSFTSSTPDNGKTVTGQASTQLNLAVMKIFGFQRFSLAVECEASMGVGNSDVVMVLDTTGSMATGLGSGTRMTALQTAMKNFYTTLKNATAGTNSRIRYGFVPFSSSVNVGRLLYDKNPSYLVDTYHVQSRSPVQKQQTSTSTASEYKPESTTAPTPTATRYNGQNSCNNNLPANGNWVTNGSSYTLPPNTVTDNDGNTVTTNTTVQPYKQTRYVCVENKSDNKWYVNTVLATRDYYVYTITTTTWVFDYWRYQERNDFDYASYKAFQPVTTNTGGSGADQTSTWAGCIEERGSNSASSFSFSTTSGITPSDAYDLDIDSAPTNSDTAWAPMWPELAYYRLDSNGNLTNNTTSRYGGKAGSYCPYQSKLLAEMTQSDFNAVADALYPSGSTYLDIGMVWGGRLSSPSGIFQDTVNVAPSNGGEVSRHIIFMTDGIMEPNYAIQSSWGIEWHDRRVTDNGYSNDASRHTSRFLAICEAIKAKGIRIWAISFTSGTSSSLSTCASTGSYYNADNSAELDEAFQEIAKQVGELRLTQ